MFHSTYLNFSQTLSFSFSVFIFNGNSTMWLSFFFPALTRPYRALQVIPGFLTHRDFPRIPRKWLRRKWTSSPSILASNSRAEWTIPAFNFLKFQFPATKQVSSLWKFVPIGYFQLIIMVLFPVTCSLPNGFLILRQPGNSNLRTNCLT